MAKKLFSLLIVQSSLLCLYAETPQVIGYFPDWGQWNSPAYNWDDIDFAAVSHVAWAFLYPDSEGNLIGLDTAENSGPLDSLISRAHENGVKVILSLGGSDGSSAFAPMASSSTARARFTHQLKAFLVERSFDGVDLDWEYSDTPSEDDTAAYSALVREIRDSVGLGYSFSLALPSGPYYGKWFSVEGFIEAIDWIGVMTYDLTGDWDESAGYNSALYPHEGITSWSWEESMDYWTGRGIAKEKLYPGIASFGFLFTTCVGPGQDFSGDVEYLTYAQILDSSSWNLYWDDTSKVPYALTPTGGYATFDNAASIALKLHWVIDNGYPGVILWELSQDYLEEGGHPILDSLATIRAEATAIQISTGTAASKIHRNGQTFWIETYGMEPSSLSLYQLNGHLLRQVRGSSGLLRLDLRNIPEGPYFVVLRRGAHLIDHQFAINPD